LRWVANAVAVDTGVRITSSMLLAAPAPRAAVMFARKTGARSGLTVIWRWV
jgi:hypothetical protein